MSYSYGTIIRYPSDLRCEHCNKYIFPTAQTIDSSTWDLVCKTCKNVVYEHPQRLERIEQIKDMLD